MVPNNRLAAIREIMKQNSIDAYLITKFDPHQSEYAAPYWNGVKFVSGFSGSNGTVVVTQTDAGLWTDGRYFVQAARELEGSGVTLWKSGEPGVQTWREYITARAPENGVIGFDGRTVSAAEAAKLAKSLAAKRVTLKTDLDIVGMIWDERPATPPKIVFDHDIRFCGRSRKEKITRLRGKMRETGGDCYVISSLDDVCWLFNLRAIGDETMTFPAYAVITPDEAALFCVSEEIAPVREPLIADGVSVYPYDAVEKFLADRSEGSNILLTPERTSAALRQAAGDALVTEPDIDLTAKLKAVKNETEISCLKAANVRDSAALLKFIVWLKKELAGGAAITEYAAGEKLGEFRRENEGYICPSFDTICAYNENAAMMHYSAPASGDAVIKAEGFLLVDSGGQYPDGTTDITRTFALGRLTDEMRTDFTLVLKSHIALAKAVFLDGATGANIDVLARQPMWERGMDYKSGTGHGVGFCLGVHETPPNISQRLNPHKLEAGMIVTDEPGAYREGKHAIRTENTLLVEEGETTEFGKFLRFDVVSFFPIDLAAIDYDMLTPAEIEWLNAYHAKVFEKLSPSAEGEELAWLKEATRAI